MSDISITQFLLIVSLVLINGFFVASEFAFVKVRPTQMETLIASGSKRALRVKSIIDDLDRSLSSTQLGITLASIGLGFVGEKFFHAIILETLGGFSDITGIGINTESRIIDGSAFVMGYLIVTFLHVVIGELAPKSISIQFAERTAMVCAEPLHWFIVMTNPLLKFFVWTSNGLLRMVGVSPAPDTHHQVYTENELKVIIGESIEKGELEQYESKLIFNILNFTDRNVTSIFTPRTDVKALPINTTPKEILKLSKEAGFSRIPIYGDTLDDIKGFVHIKDLIGYTLDGGNSEFEIENILRPVIITTERKPLDDLLKEMQIQKTQVAVTVNEYGSVEGIVTIEDILEYIVGPIDDEFDEDSNIEVQVIDDVIHADGLVTIEILNEALNSNYELEITSDSASTLARYILELSEGKLLQVGNNVQDDILEFTIAKTHGNRIDRVIISKIQK
ncbi:MAG: HlyC/CorC family transporter [Candidatus Heimdallarchaeota archaeon]|nr:HlyC/CorC family transporter [Candidatus Heimdallarchaeota archaeon]